MSTTLAKKELHGPGQKKWFLFDAGEEILGRMAVRIADILRGKDRATYTPHVDTGNFVVVINAEKVKISGDGENGEYMSYSGFMGGEKYRTVGEMRRKNPRFIVEHAVRGMMPKNRLAQTMLKKLKVYAGPEHPHAAQNPVKL
jgi:large subunit ribosomal protein L13